MGNVLIFDVETAGGFAAPKVYDCGGCVMDTATGYIQHRFHYGVLEVLGNAKAAGIAGIERFGQMSLVGERVLVQGDIHSGFARCMTDVQSAAPDADRTLQTLRDQAAQREHAQAQAPALEPTR